MNCPFNGHNTPRLALFSALFFQSPGLRKVGHFVTIFYHPGGSNMAKVPLKFRKNNQCGMFFEYRYYYQI
jgi:hypothetical protein